MRKVYVCSPYSGNVEHNIEKAKDFCNEVLLEGNMPIAPHLYFTQFMDDNNPTQREKALEFNKVLIDFCDELAVFGDHISSGMAEEIKYASSTDKLIVNMMEVLDETTN